MKSKQAQWEALERRRALGEHLCEAEWALYHYLLEQLPRARRELEVFEALRRWLEQDSEPQATEQALRAKVVAQTTTSARARLRLVGANERAPQTTSERSPGNSQEPAPTRSRSGQAWLWKPVLLAASLGLGWWGFLRWGAPLEAALGTSSRHSEKREKVAIPTAVAPPLGSQQPAARQAPGPSEASAARVELVLLAGEVQVDERAAHLGAPLLEPGSRVTTRTGKACLRLEPSTEVCLDEQTQVELSRLHGEAVSLRVERGTVVARLDARRAEQTFSLSTAELNATAQGTVFAVSRREAMAEVTVLEGKVWVRSQAPQAKPSEALLAEAHTRVRSTANAPHLISRTVRRPEEGALWALLGPEQWAAEREVGVLEIAAPKGAAPADQFAVLLAEGGPYPLPLRVVLPAGIHPLRTIGGSQERRIEIIGGQHHAVEDWPVKPPKRNGATAALTAQGSQSTEPVSAEQLLADARQHLQRNERRKALLAYRKLLSEYPNSAGAFTLRVTVAQLELALGSPERALHGFEQYLEKPGALAPEALAGKVQALWALGRKAEAKRVARVYLAKYPNGTHAAALQQRLELDKAAR